jgi:hypothetical protein
MPYQPWEESVFGVFVLAGVVIAVWLTMRWVF